MKNIFEYIQNGINTQSFSKFSFTNLDNLDPNVMFKAKGQKNAVGNIAKFAIFLLKPITSPGNKCKAFEYIERLLIKLKDGLYPLNRSKSAGQSESKFIQSLLWSLAERVKFEQNAKVAINLHNLLRN